MLTTCRLNLKILKETCNHVPKATYIRSALFFPTTKSIAWPHNKEKIYCSSSEPNRDINGKFPALSNQDPLSDIWLTNYSFNRTVNFHNKVQSKLLKPCLNKDLLSHIDAAGLSWRKFDKVISHHRTNGHYFQGVRYYSTDSQGVGYKGLSRKEKLKVAVKEYGSVVIVFHVGISLISLGISYLLVTSGMDFSLLLEKWGKSDGSLSATAAAPFVVAYALHKIFAPVRISITLVSVPFIVRYLRRIGLMKPPTK